MSSTMTLNSVTENVVSFLSFLAGDPLHTFRFEIVATLLFALGISLGRLRSSKKQPGKPAFKTGPFQGEKRPAHNNKKARTLFHDSLQGRSANVKHENLTNSAWLLARVTQLCPIQASQALQLYRAAIQAGLQLAEVPPNERRQLFQTLVPAAIRSSQISDQREVEKIFADLNHCGLGVSADLVVSAVKLYTHKQLFKECLDVFDSCGIAASDITEKAVWSCLLYCAMETKAYERCSPYISHLRACEGPPSSKDFNTMLRIAAQSNDWETSRSLIQEMRDNNIEVYNVQYNTTLAKCVEAGKTEEARALFDTMEQAEGVADVITYNTVMKAHSKVGQIEECFKVFQRLLTKGLEPSQVTYGILVDCCINAKQVDRAVDVFRDMAEKGCPLNTVLYTMVIKASINAGDYKQVMNVYQEMRTASNVSPDLITFSILIKANCDENHLKEALMLLGDMTDLGLKPDEVIYNNLLAGCGQTSNVKLGKQLYADMVSSGVRPSNVTFSILITMFKNCKLLDEAVLLLKTEPMKNKIQPEARLFVQLIQACVRGRQGRRAIEVYAMMCEYQVPAAKANNTILSTSMSVNMYDTAAEIVQIAVTNGSHVDARDLNAIAEGALKKGKTIQVQSCVSAMEALGHAVDPKFRVC